jgi:hypothetical protein
MFFCSVGFHCQLDVSDNFSVALWCAVHFWVRDSFFILSIDDFEKITKTDLHCCHAGGCIAASW